jgi:signal transduction histidine kinase
MVTANFMAKTLNEAGYETLAADSQTEALAIFQERRADLVLTNYYLGQGNGLALLRLLFKIDPEALAVMTTGVGNERLAREAIVCGAIDYVVKSGNFYRDLPALVKDSLERHRKELFQKEEEVQRTRLEAQVELAGWLDHNFKNILSASLGSLALINFNNPLQSNVKRAEYIQDSVEGIKSAIGLLERLSVMSMGGSAEDARVILISQVVDQAFQNILDSLERPENSDNLALKKVAEKVNFINQTRHLSPQHVVYADLLTILESLFKNSLEAMTQTKEIPTLIVSVEKNSPYLVFQVQDNGRGMDEKIRRYAFEPLFSTKGEVGVGVSLAIVRSLVFKHLGEISCESAKGGGSTFTFTYFVGDD